VYGTKIRTDCIISDCKNMIEKNDYQAGHIVSEFNGGSTTLDNLYPICSTCNQRMSKHNWIDYDEKSYKQIKNKNRNLISINI
jgi:5-methylcytosine-specific restriction endonuclease McrA